MALIVEDGTGLSTAESFLSVADAVTILGNFGLDVVFSTKTTSEQEAALRNATLFIEDRYSHRYNGVVTNETQALSWPRYNATRISTQAVLSSVVPVEVEKAVAFVAEEQFTTSVFNGDTAVISSEAVGLGSGAITESVTYVGGKSQTFESNAADFALTPLLHSNGTPLGRA